MPPRSVNPWRSTVQPIPRARAFLVAAALALLTLAAAGSTGAATITVTGTGDTIAVDGVVTLREAIVAANTNAASADAPAGDPGPTVDEIHFNISGPGPHTIQPLGGLPVISDPVVIDGYTEPGASPNTQPTGMGLNTVLMIELDGQLAGDVRGLDFLAENSALRGLAINRFDSFPDGTGVVIHGDTVIAGNFIGTNVTGTSAMPNEDGMIIEGANNTVGGTDPAARNLISGNHDIEINVWNDGPGGNVIAGNLIGTDVTGAAILSSDDNGVRIIGPNNSVGGATAAARNVISGNGSGIQIRGENATGNVVAGNFIGTDVTGTIALGNDSYGVWIHGASSNTVGGITAVPGTPPGNVISGNAPGVWLSLSNFFIPEGNNIVAGNLIGTDVSGTTALPNIVGVQIDFNAADNMIGGTDPGAGNVISDNYEHGVVILPTTDSSASRNAVLGNSIFANGGLGIDLSGDGVTANDTGDGDTGPNNLQNFPILTSALFDGVATTITGTLNSESSKTYRVELFANDDCDDPSGHGEGAEFVGGADATTDGVGNASFSAVAAGDFGIGSLISATATDPNGNTSEFSACREVQKQVIVVGIDIKPGVNGNSIKVNKKGKIPVAVLSSAAFDAPADVDRSSLTFGRTGEEGSLSFCSPGGEDVNGDGLLDLLCHFVNKATGLRLGDTVAFLEGTTLNGRFIGGQDTVRMIK